MSEKLEYGQACEILFPFLEDVYARWGETSARVFSDAVRQAPAAEPTCRKGCGACCHFPLIPVTAGEAFVLLNHLLASGRTLLELHALFSKYAQSYFAAAVKNGLPFTDAQQGEFLKLKLPCPLLTLTPTPTNPMSGHCSAFGVRPLICEFYHSTDDPALCAQKKAHGSVAAIMERGDEAVEQVRLYERMVFGRSALGHLPLLLAALCTNEGLQEFLTCSTEVREAEEEDVEAQARVDFEFYCVLLRAAGYEITSADIHSLMEAADL